MADKNIQITVRNPANTDWDELYPVTKAENIIGLENLTTTEKTNLVSAINEVDGDLETHKADDATDAHLGKNIGIEDTAGNFTSTDVEAALAEVMDEVTAHKAETAKMIKIKTNIAILQTNWVDDTGDSGYWLYDVTDTDITADMAVDVYIHLTSIANSTMLLPVNKSDAGKFTLYASSEPNEDIIIDYSVFNQIGGV